MNEELIRNEEVIARYFEVGEALRAIRDKHLYRGTHSSFEQYCREKYGDKTYDIFLDYDHWQGLME